MNGGGVQSSNGSAWTMSNSVIKDNVAPYNGGGVGANNSITIYQGCIIKGNTANDNG